MDLKNAGKLLTEIMLVFLILFIISANIPSNGLLGLAVLPGRTLQESSRQITVDTPNGKDNVSCEVIFGSGYPFIWKGIVLSWNTFDQICSTWTALSTSDQQYDRSYANSHGCAGYASIRGCMGGCNIDSATIASDPVNLILDAVFWLVVSSALVIVYNQLKQPNKSHPKARKSDEP
jgi:hypothetical protein